MLFWLLKQLCHHGRPAGDGGGVVCVCEGVGGVHIQVILGLPHTDSNGCHPSVMMIHPRLLPASGSSLGS